MHCLKLCRKLRRRRKIYRILRRRTEGVFFYHYYYSREYNNNNNNDREREKMNLRLTKHTHTYTQKNKQKTQLLYTAQYTNKMSQIAVISRDENKLSQQTQWRRSMSVINRERNKKRTITYTLVASMTRGTEHKFDSVLY